MKTAKYFGVFRSEPIGDSPAYVDKMGVVSFARIGRGGKTLMAYGWRVENGVTSSTSRQADGMFFYTSEKAMDNSLEVAAAVDRVYERRILDMEFQLRELKRARRVEVERVLNAKAVQPLELED